jgi:hypothetical protein
VLRDHRDEVEADLQRFYGLDLAGLYRGELRLRRLSVLLRLLPMDAATVRALTPADGRDWDVDTYLIADLYHALTGKPHPARPKPKKEPTSATYWRHRRALEAQRRRHAPPST